VKQIFNISKEGDHSTAKRVLAIKIGARHCNFSISEYKATQLFRLAWYSGGEISENNLRDIYIKHPELRGSFHKVLVCYDHPESIFVPDSYYKQDDSRVMLETMYGRNGKDVIINEAVSGWQLQNIYSVPQDVKDWVTGHFSLAQQWHNSTIAIKHINTTDFEGGLLIDFREFDFSVIVSKANKLLMVQTYFYSAPSDVIYYLLKICKEFLFMQEQVRLTISGLVEKESALYRELYQYFLQVRFREPFWQIPVSEQQEYPAHFFTALNDLSLCAS
jgi:Protein of unknown function (DUF3822)